MDQRSQVFSCFSQDCLAAGCFQATFGQAAVTDEPICLSHHRLVHCLYLLKVYAGCYCFIAQQT